MEAGQKKAYQPLSRLFLRFLRFGLLAWGGPAAQIDMIRQELVEEEKWISRKRFNRVLGVYQVLPGPEAHELCVYFGMLSRGRIGGLLSGLGFMLPGLLLILALSWFYTTFGIASPFWSAVFYGLQAAVAALVFRAAHRISSHAMEKPWLLFTGFMAFLGAAMGGWFLPILVFSGLSSLFFKKKRPFLGLLLAISILLAAISTPAGTTIAQTANHIPDQPSPSGLLFTGLKAGLLTFGGAYTSIPFLQNDAVYEAGWMTNSQFLDGLALSGIIPAPMIIFGTFVGYLGGGFAGALLVTVGIFFPAFAFTLAGHRQLERLFKNRPLSSFLDGITAGVAGLITATAASLFSEGVRDIPSLAIFALSLCVLYRMKSKGAVAAVMLLAGLAGLLLSH